MNARKVRSLQNEFFRRCIESMQPLDDVFQDLKIPHETFVSWMAEREFQSRLGGMRRFLRQAREVQLELSAYRAASVLDRNTAPPKEATGTPATRSALVDVIRLARDARARRRSHQPDAVGKAMLHPHPDLSNDEAAKLISELADADSIRHAEEAPKGGPVRG